MKFWRAFICIGIICCLSGSAFAKNKKHRRRAVSAPAPAVYGTQNLISEINRVVQSMDSYDTTIGVVIKSMKHGDTLYTKNGQKLFVPASTLKILTAEAALLYLGPDFKFKTRFLTDAKAVDNGVLDGNLYLVHSGDPSLTYSDLADLVTALRAQQIQEIVGNIYIDNSAYDQVNHGPGWLWSDKKSCYGAPINASIINHNCLSFTLLPSQTPGDTAEIVPNPRESFTPVRNEVITKPRHTRSCYLRLGETEDDLLSISGCIPKGGYPRGISTVVTDAVQYNKMLLSDLFRRSGIKINGEITAGTAPPDLSTLATHESKPLQQLISDMLKKI